MAGSHSQSPLPSPPQVTNLLNNLLAQSKKAVRSSYSFSPSTTPNVSLVPLLTSEKLTLMAQAESASAAPVSLDCEQADRRKWLGEPQLQQRTEFC